MTTSTSIDLNLDRKEMVILGTQYAREMKKGLFGVMHYLMPKRNILSLHSSNNMGKDGDVALFFGLSGMWLTDLTRARIECCVHGTAIGGIIYEKRQHLRRVGDVEVDDYVLMMPSESEKLPYMANVEKI
ncbi:hypothetical protein ZIOFF_006008 [Zingiber officinale]|uniref:phosphoenolpyruvate carboxykinase (ATP) n=1 Tax=Zingiber officinale TaxID=94328 RepID=A0A8J5IB07_ZINOF|nr:hypothetical protein ZIOFF_006008 [Zingiber officinale]